MTLPTAWAICSKRYKKEQKRRDVAHNVWNTGIMSYLIDTENSLQIISSLPMQKYHLKTTVVKNGL